MKKTLALLTVAALAGSVASAAEISGKVKLTGTPPAEKTIPLDAACGKSSPANQDPDAGNPDGGNPDGGNNPGTCLGSSLLSDLGKPGKLLVGSLQIHFLIL